MAFDPSASVDMGPFLASLKETVSRHLPSSSSKLEIFLTSASLQQTSLTTLGNIAYISPMASELGVNDLCHFLSSRASYLESALICVASLVNHVFWFTVYTGLMVATLGLSSNINHCFKKHWYNIALSVSCLFISTVGTLVPTLGAYGNLGLIFFCYKIVSWDYGDDLQDFEKPLVKEVKEIFEAQRENIELCFLNLVNSEQYYHTTVKGAIDGFGSRLEEATNVDNLFDAFAFALKNFPNVEQKHPPPSPFGKPKRFTTS